MTGYLGAAWKAWWSIPRRTTNHLRCLLSRLLGRPHLGVIDRGDGILALPEEPEGRPYCRVCGMGTRDWIVPAREVEALLKNLARGRGSRWATLRMLNLFRRREDAMERWPDLCRMIDLALKGEWEADARLARMRGDATAAAPAGAPPVSPADPPPVSR